MCEVIVHGIPGSPYVRAVLLTLEEKNIGWRLAGVPFGANLTALYGEIHPFHKMPTLDHGEFRLYETLAILNYIDRIAPAPALRPLPVRAAARMDQVIGIVDAYAAPRLSAALSFPRLIAPMLALPVDEAAVRDAIDPAAEVVDELSRLLGGQTFMAGDSLSLADLMLAPHLVTLPHFAEGRTLLRQHDNLSAWIILVEARPSMACTTMERLLELTGIELLPIEDSA
jgi:glutathione S-transferase